jgi:glycine/D-amino acid oxidase-like deaminating enzyme
MRRGAGRVVLVERHELGSQTSPRAAGMVNYMRKSELMIELVKLAGKHIREFSRETGEPLSWVASGSLKVARRPQDAEVLEWDLERGCRMGLDVELVSSTHAQRLNPFLRPDGIEAVLRVGDDMYFDPAQVAVGFARAAHAAGATVLANTDVSRVLVEGGAVRGVETDGGVIETPVVVDAAGAWTRAVAAASGIDVPIVATRQQLFVTESVDGADPSLPMVRIMDAAVYMRPCDAGLLWGVYEDEPLFFDADAVPREVDLMPLDSSVLWRAADDVQRQLPILREAHVREHRGGIPTMTADGQHIVGPAPGVSGFYFASGCNVAGLSISPALGEMLAGWIIDGAPSLDLTPLTLARFPAHVPEAQLRRDAAWQYRHFYGAT